MKDTTQMAKEVSKGKLYSLVMVMAIIPLIVHQKKCYTYLENYRWFTEQKTTSDFFLYYKSFFLIAMAVWMLFILVTRKKEKNWLKVLPKFMIPIGLYGVFILLSMLVSKDHRFSLEGTNDQYESGFVLLSYLVFFVYAYFTVKNEGELQYVMKAWMISIGILCVLGLLQVTGHDFYATDFGKKLITNRELWDSLDSVSFSFGKNRVYLSLYNPNYVGVYVSLALPILCTLLLFSKKKQIKIITGLLSIGMVIAIIGSESKTALLSIAIIFFCAILLFRKKMLKYWKYLLGICIGLFVMFFAVDTMIQHAFTNNIKNAIHSMKETRESVVTAVETLDNEVVIHYKGTPIHIQYSRNNTQISFELKDGNGNPILSSASDGSLYLTEQKFEGISLTPVSFGDFYGFQVSIGVEFEWYFSNETGEEGYYYYTPYGKWDKINNPPSVKIKENIFSGRGYLWSRTLPLLKNPKYFFLGSGPDTFTIVFPQDDYIGMELNGYKGSIVTKPHNLYLQIAVQTGVPSLIAFLVLCFWYVGQSFRLYWKRQFESYYEQVGAGILLAVLGYLIAGIVNDSTVCVAPIFWVLLGIGFSINQALLQQGKMKEKTLV